MKVIIVEDESTAILKLEALLKKADPAIEIIGKLESVKDAVSWIKNHPSPDLGFFDIQLSDDISFRIFDHCEVDFPVVFITAFDDYLLRAFEYNSLHYVLKPINEEKISGVLHKIRKIEKHFVHNSLREISSGGKNETHFKSRLVVRKGLDFSPVEVSDIAYIFTEHKITFIRDKLEGIYMIDQTLSDLEKDLDPRIFFRVNRQYLVNISAIKKFRSIDQSKILIDLSPKSKDEVIISKEHAPAFRKWIGK